MSFLVLLLLANLQRVAGDVSVSETSSFEFVDNIERLYSETSFDAGDIGKCCETYDEGWFTPKKKTEIVACGLQRNRDLRSFPHRVCKVVYVEHDKEREYCKTSYRCCESELAGCAGKQAKYYSSLEQARKNASKCYNSEGPSDGTWQDNQKRYYFFGGICLPLVIKNNEEVCGDQIYCFPEKRELKGNFYAPHTRTHARTHTHTHTHKHYMRITPGIERILVCIFTES